MIVIVLLLIFSPLFRFLVTHFHLITTWGLIDIYRYFKYKKYNECPYFGRVDITTAHRNKVFGSGKTLDITMKVREIYSRYNGLPVWDEEKKDFVIQHIHIISNVEFTSIPYVKFYSAEQLKTVEQEPQDITIFVFDEIGAIWNSRNYKDNISTELLKHLLQVRKNKIYIIGSSQRFKFVDALLRQITAHVICVNKTWRIMKRLSYDPFELENCTNMDMLKPLSKEYRFIFNKDYLAYDTNQKVDDFMKLDILPDEEILRNQGITEGDLSQSTGLKKRYKKRIRK